MRVGLSAGQNLVDLFAVDSQQFQPLYEMADLSTVWIQAQVYEDDLEFLPNRSEQTQAGQSDEGRSARHRHHAGVCPTNPSTARWRSSIPTSMKPPVPVSVRFELEEPGAQVAGRAGTATVTIKVPPKKLPMFARIAEGGERGPAEVLGEGRGVGRARNGRDRHRQPDDCLPPEQRPGCSRGWRSNWGRGMSGPHD